MSIQAVSAPFIGWFLPLAMVGQVKASKRRLENGQGVKFALDYRAIFYVPKICAKMRGLRADVGRIVNLTQRSRQQAQRMLHRGLPHRIAANRAELYRFHLRCRPTTGEAKAHPTFGFEL